MALALLDAKRAQRFVEADSPEGLLLAEIERRKLSLQPEMTEFASRCDRWDNLYYPNEVLDHAGASHWADHYTAHTAGQAHVSVNSPPAYVDIPASLQAVEPIENVVSAGTEDTERQLAAMVERIYYAWKADIDFEVLAHKACVVKGLYGRTAAKVVYDEDRKRPSVTIVDQPRHLYLGWGHSDYTRLNWCLYVYQLTPESVQEDWGLDVSEINDGGVVIPIVRDALTEKIPAGRGALMPGELKIEVYDYWYRKPKPRSGRERFQPIEFETWNAIFVGNIMVKNEVHEEYGGKMPYVPLFNTYIPGVPDGRPELFDIEALIREKDERITAGAQMMNKSLHQPFQLVGPEAPDVVPTGLKPVPDRIMAPGAGNRVEPINPWLPEFQLESFLVRIDREMTEVSGINELLRGLANQTVLSSSKAIATLVANYEARIRMKRDLFYLWRKDVWHLAEDVWKRKLPLMKDLLSTPYTLDVKPPSLTPRDDTETASMATNLLINKVWSQDRAMNTTGVDDPESEKVLIRGERTDATTFPQDVLMMAQVLALLKQMGFIAPAAAQNALARTGQGMGGALMNPELAAANQRAALGGGTGQPMLNAPEEQAQLPPEAQPANAPGGGPMTVQSMTQGGEVSTRVLQQQEVGGPPNAVPQ